MTHDAQRDLPEVPADFPPARPAPANSDATPDGPPVRSGEQFDGGTDEDEKAGAGFGEGDDARRVREQHGLPEPD